ncbi:MAG: DUF4157 domain-containing protein, partial [Patescibacteria group bacterium]
IVFGAGQHQPKTTEGKRLLAHELVHVGQQSSGRLKRDNDRRTQGENNTQVSINCSPGIVIARSPEGASPTPHKKVPAMTPEDMYNKLTAERVFEEHIPVHELEATEKKLEAMRVKLEKSPSPKLRRRYNKLLNRYNLSRLGGPGAPAGAGYNTYAIIQVVDKDGNVVATAEGKYTGGKHAEEIAVAKLRKELKGSKVFGGRMEVVGDKVICSEKCRPALREFAKDHGLDKVDGHVFRREKLVGKGRASEKTTIRTITKKSSEGKVPTRISEVVYTKTSPGSEPGKPPTPRPGGGAKPSTFKPAPKASTSKPGGKGPTSALKPPKTATRGKGPTATPSRSGGRATLSGGNAVRVGNLGLGLFSSLSTLVSAFDQINSIKTENISPKVRSDIKFVKEAFPDPIELWRKGFFYKDKEYQKAVDWVHLNGMKTFMVKGKMLSEMADQLNIIDRTAWDSNPLISDYYEYFIVIQAPLITTKSYVTRLYDAEQKFEKMRDNVLSESEALMIQGIISTIVDVRTSLEHLSGMLSWRSREYMRFQNKAREMCMDAVEVLNLWVPAFQKVWKEETGKFDPFYRLPKCVSDTTELSISIKQNEIRKKYQRHEAKRVRKQMTNILGAMGTRYKK